MPVFKARVQGSNLLLEMDDEPLRPHGFTVVVWVTAESMRSARRLAIEAVRTDRRVAGHAGLRLEVPEIEAGDPDDEGRPSTGFMFFPMDETSH